jgi:Ser/Thr protein kinase RdoA (MazF antagonist)
MISRMPERSPAASPDLVRQLAADALGRAVVEVDRIPRGFGNENWRVVTAGGDAFVVKLGEPAWADKWAATAVAYQQAQAAGVPAPRLVHLDTPCEAAGGRVVRILTWMDGAPPESVLSDAAKAERFFADLGRSLRALHRAELPAFTSRLDGSAPRFDTWVEYVAFRLPHIVDRTARGGAFSAQVLDAFTREATALAAAVSPYVRPALCHRDLNLGNLLADDEGGLAAILDFDGSEAWDPAVDMVKVWWEVVPHHPEATGAFIEAYFDGGVPPRRWEERVRLVSLLELVNAVANARLEGDRGFEARARAELRRVWPR